MMGQGPWLEVTFGKGVRPLRAGEAVLAEGTFGPDPKHVSYSMGPPPADTMDYDLLPFTVTSTSPLPKDADEDEIFLERL